MFHLLIVDPDAATTAWLKALLMREGYAVESIARGDAALDAIKHNAPDLIVFERDLPDQDGLEMLRQIRAHAPGIAALVLSARGGADQIVAGLDAGADDYIIKQPGAEIELVAKIRAILAKPKPAPPAAPTPRSAFASDAPRGKIFAFISAKGGTGTSSICLNTATALAKLDPHAEILIVDMVFPLGTIGQSIGFETRETIAKLSQNKGQLDRAALEKSISPLQRWGFRVLIGANDPQEASQLEVSQIVPIFDLLLQMFDYVCVDFGRALSRISIPVLELAHAIVIILTPDSNTVRMTRLTLHYLESLGILGERIVLINNRPIGRVWISKEESEKELGLPLATTVPYEQEYFTMAINAGVPFMEKFPDHAASLMFTDIARLLRDRVSHERN